MRARQIRIFNFRTHATRGESAARNGLLYKRERAKKSLSLISLLALLKGNKKRQNARGLIFKPSESERELQMGGAMSSVPSLWMPLNAKSSSSSTSFYLFYARFSYKALKCFQLSC